MAPLRHLPFQTDAQRAMERCAPKPFASLLRWIRPLPQLPGAKALPRVEALWFPFYLFTFHVTSPKGDGAIPVCVDGWSGAFALFELAPLLADGMPEGPYFPPALDSAEAERIARNDLLNTIMRQRSAHGPKPVPGVTQHQELIAYPFWVYYYYRKAGLIDIKICDGVVGDLLGLRTRSGVLNALKTHPRPAAP